MQTEKKSAQTAATVLDTNKSTNSLFHCNTKDMKHQPRIDESNSELIKRQVHYRDRDQFILEAKRYFDSIDSEFDDTLYELTVKIYEITETAFLKGYETGLKAQNE
ncbi:MAG: hypothetical protein PUK20_00210 [Firmicutes bacterium]|nr:hypothetical protein [Bacillota bacterium]MDY4107620.1 hypothetical protein [Oscillospiraceae bacterium]